MIYNYKYKRFSSIVNVFSFQKLFEIVFPYMAIYFFHLENVLGNHFSISLLFSVSLINKNLFLSITVIYPIIFPFLSQFALDVLLSFEVSQYRP